jgi:NAD(P)-dependent dehydrogenase (short-subunit alcohol dehydrogenase family)
MNIYQGKVSVVTGAGSGIGRALAAALAQRGARLALSDVDAAGLQETRALCGSAELRCYVVDVSNRDQVFAHAEQVKNDFGTAHFIFSNAGVALAATFEQSTVEEIEWQLGVNLWGVIYCNKAFLPMLLAQREGHLVNVSSIFGLIGFYGNSAYNISKFGVRGLTECLWWELEGTGVKATTVHPGGIRTQIARKARLGRNASPAIREMTAKFDHLLLTPPEVCAREILDGVARGKKKIMTGHRARTTDILARLFSTSYHWFVKRDAGA